MTVLLVIATFILLIMADYVIRRIRTPEYEIALEGKTVERGIGVADFRLPRGVFFHPGHAWAVLQPTGKVRVGVDDFVQMLIGSVHNIRPLPVGVRIQQGDPLLFLKVDSRDLSLPAPISGRVTSINQILLDHLPLPGIKALNREWIVALEPSNLPEELIGLTIAAKAREWLSREIERLKEFLVIQAQRPELAGLAIQDRGEPVPGALGMLDVEGIKQFENEFLHVSEKSPS